jgi:hypothetical protein
MNQTQTRPCAFQGTRPVVYSSLALGLLAGVALSTYLWRRKLLKEREANIPPLERAEQLIASCEAKLDGIERSMRELQEEKK